MEKKKKLGLALGSGGARGLCHIGALAALLDAGLEPDIITGCSMGAVVAALYAAGVELDAMEKAALTLKTGSIVEAVNPFRNGLIKGDRSLSLLKKFIGDKKFKDCKIPLGVTAADLVRGELVEFTSGPIWRAVRASYSIPVFFRPVEVGKRMLVDGGVLERIPVNLCRRLGADIVVAVDAIGDIAEEPVKNSLPSVIERVYMLFDYNAFRYVKNEADILIAPAMAKRVFQFSKNNEQIPAGRSAVEDALPTIKELLSQ